MPVKTCGEPVSVLSVVTLCLWAHSWPPLELICSIAPQARLMGKTRVLLPRASAKRPEGYSRLQISPAAFLQGRLSPCREREVR